MKGLCYSGCIVYSYDAMFVLCLFGVLRVPGCSHALLELIHPVRDLHPGY